MSRLFSMGYEIQGSWTPTGNEQSLNKSELSQITKAVVREKELEDGTVIRNVIFMMKSGKPVSFKLSPYNEQFPSGTQIDPKSVVIGEYANEEGELKYTVTCEKA